MTAGEHPSSDRELWRRFAAPAGVACAPTPTELASWLEGRLSGAEAARVEAAIAADREMRQAALDLADILGNVQAPAPARLIIRAQALVGFAGRVPARRRWWPWLVPASAHYRLQRMAMAMAVLLIACGGFLIGGGLGESFAQQHYGTSHFRSAASADTPNEMNDLFASDGI